MVALVNARSVMLAALPRRYTVVLPTNSLVGDMDDPTAWSENIPQVTLAVASDGAVGPTVRRSPVGVSSVFAYSDMFQLDRTRVYRVIFYARAAAGTNGTMYFTLRQFLANGAVGPANQGRDPYNPVNVTPHTSWLKYETIWRDNGSIWQAGVTQIRPDFLLNYGGNAGYWEVQGFRMTDITDAYNAGADAAAALVEAQEANDAITAITSNGVLDRSEKADLVLRKNTIDSEAGLIVAQASALGVPSTAYSAAKTALHNYLVGLTPAWDNTALDTNIDRTVFNTKFKDYSDAKVALKNAIYAKNATTAEWTTVSNRPPDSNILNSAIRLGSRNFFLNSQYFVESPNNTGNGVQTLMSEGTPAYPFYRIVATNTVSTYGSVYTFPKIPIGTVCTISADVRIASADLVGFYGGIGMQSVPANKWTRIFHTFTYDPAARATAPVGFTCGLLQLDVKNYKIEIGNIGSDWTPAPEDYDAALKTERDRIDGMSSDGVLSRNEKIDLVQRAAIIVNETDSLVIQASTMGVSATLFTNARTALDNYLVSLFPLWNNTLLDTNIVRSDFNNAFNNYQTQKVALINALNSKASEKALWSNIVGQTNAPASNATVGAPAGTNVGSTPAETVEARANGAIATPVGYGLSVTNSGTTASPTSGTYEQSRTLGTTVTGAVGTITYAWTFAATNGSNGVSRINSASGSSVTLTCRGSMNSYEFAVTCTISDSTTGLSRTASGYVIFNFGTGF